MKTSFLQTLLGLLVAPQVTISTLNEDRQLQYLPQIVLTFITVAFGPVIILFFRYDFLVTRINDFLILNAILGLTVILYLIFESIFLRLMLIEIPVRGVVASFCYGLAPLVPLLILCYLIDVILTGKLSIATFIITGVADPNHAILKNFFYTHLLAKVLFLVNLYWSIRYIGRAGPLHALAATILSSLPFYGAYFLSCYLIGFFSQGAVNPYFLLEQTLKSLPNIF